MKQAQIGSDSTMAEVLEEYPGAQRAMMRRYHIGGCSSCGFSPDERLGDVLKRHNVLAVDEVLAHIRESAEQEARMQIEPSELAEALKSEAAPTLLDVRSPEEFETAAIDRAKLVTQELADEMMTGWPKDTPIVTYCHHGMRSLDAASYFVGHGFTNVRSLAGGIDRWSQEVDDRVPRY